MDKETYRRGIGIRIFIFPRERMLPVAQVARRVLVPTKTGARDYEWLVLPCAVDCSHSYEVLSSSCVLSTAGLQTKSSNPADYVDLDCSAPDGTARPGS